MISTPLHITADHPAYAGHFPGMPVLPGVVLLDAALRQLSGSTAAACQWQIGSAKFQSAVRPGEPLTLQHEALAGGTVRFSIRTADRAVASGTFVPAQEARGEQG